MNETSLAAQQAVGLRRLADMLEAHPDVAQTMSHALGACGAYLLASEVEEIPRLVRAAKAFGATVTKNYTGSSAEVVAAFGPVRVWLHTHRANVCERVVTGTETVTKTVPDPELLAQVPEIEVTEEVETVAWRCRPLLGEAS